MVDPGLIRIQDFDYPLPEERIAQFPLSERDESRLLILRNGIISQSRFSEISRFIPPESLLVFNDTKVIRARLIFKKNTGAHIEIFCLEPLAPVTEVEAVFREKASCVWKCLIGNVKRWRSGLLQMELEGMSGPGILYAERGSNLGDGGFAITFRWEPPEMTFSEVLDAAGTVPLPPYIHRQTVPDDAGRYQTIYARHEGSVAAPTAGLHFTDRVMKNIEQLGCRFAKVTLHVGVGTFRPVSSPTLQEHIMHSEKIIVSRQTIAGLISGRNRPVIAVGTTSARTLESLFWLGVKILKGETGDNFHIMQWDPYQVPGSGLITRDESLTALLHYLDQNRLDELHGETQLIIVPGYNFKIISGLITNFHMPQSTLLLLVAALTGDKWKDAYRFALENGFRFLSYGDCCLFFKTH